MKTVGAKLNFVFAFLSVLNVTFLTMILYENQIDLITEITQYETKKAAEDIYAELHKMLKDIRNNPDAYNSGNIFEKLIPGLKKIVPDFIIFSKEGESFFQSNSEFYLKKGDLEDAENAFSEYEKTGRYFYSRISSGQSEIHFFVPVYTAIKGLEEFVLLFRLKAAIDGRMNRVYKLLGSFFVLNTLVYILFVFFLQRIVTAPLKSLARKSREISDGNYLSRIDVNKNDEIGKLAVSFNTMVNSIRNKLKVFNRQEVVMQQELKIAARVQQTIYPKSKNTPFFNLACYHKPYLEVSGDYYHVLQLDKNRYGIIIADTAGHSVSTALTTLLIKCQFEAMAPHYTDSKKLMKKLDDTLAHFLMDCNISFTAFYLILDRNRVITFSNAAHPRAFILRPGAAGCKILDTDGFYIGLPPILNRIYTSRRLKLLGDDRIFLYTDGIINAVNSKQKPYGIDRLQNTAARNMQYPCTEMLNHMVTDFQEYCNQAARRDDETLIIIELKP